MEREQAGLQSEENARPQHADCVRKFIEEVWNASSYNQIDDLLHPEFVDHSMPFSLFQNQEGLLMYLKEMAQRVYHRTEILELRILDNLVICEIRITIKARTDPNDTATHIEIIHGLRVFKMHENRIIAHWEMI